jgi:hypothetical protein
VTTGKEPGSPQESARSSFSTSAAHVGLRTAQKERPAGAGHAPSAAAAILGHIAAVVGVLAGLVYLAGLVMLWIRLYRLDLPARETVAYLPREFVISIGLRDVVLPFAVTTAFVLAEFLVIETAERRRRALAQRAAERRERFGVSGPAHQSMLSKRNLYIVVIGGGAYVLAWGLFVERSLLPQALAFLVWMAVAFPALTFIGRTLRRANEEGHITRTTRRVAALLSSAIVATPLAIVLADRFYEPQDAVVCLSDSGVISGVLIGATDSAVYVGSYPESSVDNETASATPHVIAVMSDAIERYYYGPAGLTDQSAQLCRSSEGAAS